MTTTLLDPSGRSADQADQQRSGERHQAVPASATSDRTGPHRSQRIPVAIVGAGYIAGYHLEVLRQLDAMDVVGACDPDASRLEALRRQWNIPVGASSLDELLGKCHPAAVHVLVPPPFHFDVTRAALEAGLHVLVEKPMTLRAGDCATLLALAEARRVCLRVNHNAVFHPAFRRLLADIERRRLGRVDHVASVNCLPLAQLESGDHDHWMFREPANILFEQATHPLSQICAVLGAVRDVVAMRSAPQLLKTGAIFHTQWQLSLSCERGTAQLFIAFGPSFPHSTIQVLGQDAAARIDLLNDTYTLDRSTKYLEPVDRAVRSLRFATDMARDGLAGFSRYVLSTLRLRTRTDPYYVSMLDSIASFYGSIGGGEDVPPPALDGMQVVSACELAAENLLSNPTPRAALAVGRFPRQPTPLPVSSNLRVRQSPSREADVLVLGGSGFIGRHVVAGLTGSGHSVRVMTRRPTAHVAAGAGRQPCVRTGDIQDGDAVARAVEGCRSVIHLVSGAPPSWPEYERLFIDGTRRVAEACLRAGVEQLLFASSIAVYYLGGGKATITEETPLDENPQRSEYTRAKVACERLLSRLHDERGLPVTIFRPGVVVGAGGTPLHLGVGYWPTPTHCVAWGRQTRRPLPFVLAEDVAAALVSAIDRRGLDGQSFNLVGDVRLSADEYVAALREASGRDIQLHRQAVLKWYGVDLAKWVVKTAARKRDNVFPSYRNFASWTLRSAFDCSRAKRLLGWTPVAERERFIELGIRRAVRPDAEW